MEIQQCLREAAKKRKSSPLNGRAIKAYTPIPHRAQWPLKFWNVGKKGSKKSSLILNGPTLYPPPLSY